MTAAINYLYDTALLLLLQYIYLQTRSDKPVETYIAKHQYLAQPF